MDRWFLHKHATTFRINLPLFSTIVPSNICMFLFCRPFVVITTLSTPTRPVDNVVITTKGLQDRNIHILDGTTVENKGKLILTEICPLVQKKWYLKVLKMLPLHHPSLIFLLLCLDPFLSADFAVPWHICLCRWTRLITLILDPHLICQLVKIINFTDGNVDNYSEYISNII